MRDHTGSLFPCHSDRSRPQAFDELFRTPLLSERAVMTPGNGNPAKSTHVCVSPFLRNGCQSRLSPYHLHYTSRSLWKVEVARAWTKSRHKSCLSVIDLGITRRFKERDKRGGRLLLAEVKRLCFPDNYRLTTKVCEAFFDDDSNFDLDRDPVAEEARAVVGT